MKAITIFGLLLLVSGCASSMNSPAGFYKSFPIVKHDRTDLFIFGDGKVTLSTCCTPSSGWGTYERNSKGDWVWRSGLDYRVSEKFGWEWWHPNVKSGWNRGDFLLYPSKRSLKIVSLANPMHRAILPRSRHVESPHGLKDVDIESEEEDKTDFIDKAPLEDIPEPPG